MPTWKYLLKSLYSNQTIIDGRRRPWYWAVMFFVLSIFLMIVVPMSQTYLSDGTSYFSAGNDCEVSRGLYQLSQNELFQNLYIEDGELKDKTSTLADNAFYDESATSADETFFKATDIYYATPGVGTAISTPPDTDFVYYGYISNDDGSNVRVAILSVYSTNLDPLNSSDDASELSTLINQKILRNIDENGESITSNLPVNRSFMIFTPTGLYIYMYSPLPTNNYTEDAEYPLASSSTTYSSYFVGSFQKIDYFDFAELECTEAYTMPTEGNDSEFAQKWYPFLSETYYPIRNKTLWTQLGIVMGVTAGAILLAGLVIWLFTLGRKNLLHKNCTLWEGIKMAATLSFTVALIGCFLYFLGSAYAWMFGAMGLILRTMWLIMKTTGSNAQSDQKPLYQAR